MTTKDKRSPAFEDLDKMPFGKHSGELLQDVPANYLAWLWREGLSGNSGNGEHQGRPGLENLNMKRKLANYVWNSRAAIEQEMGETL